MRNRPKKYRRYSDAERAAVLAHYQHFRSISATANHCGVPEETVRNWIITYSTTHKDVVRLKEQNLQRLDDLFEQIAYRACSLALERLHEASVRDLMVAAAIATDKRQLLRNQPTSIMRADTSEEDRALRLLEILDRAAARRSQLPGGERGVLCGDDAVDVEVATSASSASLDEDADGEVSEADAVADDVMREASEAVVMALETANNEPPGGIQPLERPE